MSRNYLITLRDRFLHDRGSMSESFQVDALAASGDLFITFATRLDELTHMKDAARLNPILEDIIRTLIYLQQHYAVVKKPANYRQ